MKTNTVSGNIWNDYIVIGLAVTMLMTILKLHGGTYQIVPAAAFLCLTGLRDNVKVMLIKRNIFGGITAAIGVACLCLVWVNSAFAIQAAAYYVTVLAGYCLFFRCEGRCGKALGKLAVFVIALILIDLSGMIRGSQPAFFLGISVDIHKGILSALDSTRSIMFLLFTGIGIILGRYTFGRTTSSDEGKAVV